MRRHLDDESLTRLAASGESATGTTDDSVSARHVARCASCDRRLRDLRAVRYTLGTLSEPQPPENLARAITTRLEDSSGGLRGADQARRSPLTHPVNFRWLRAVGPRHLGILSAIAVGAGAISMALTGGGSGASSTLPDLAGPSSAPDDTPRSAQINDAPAPVEAPRDSGNRVLVSSDLGSATIPLVLGPEDYRHTTLGDGVNALFGSAAKSSPDAMGASTRTAVMPTGECLRAVGRSIDHAPATTWTLVGVKVARFQGRPATILAFVGTESRNNQVAVAVDGTCTSADPLVLDQAVVSSQVDS